MGNSLAAWLDILFGVKLSQHPALKNRLNSYSRNNTIVSYLEKENHTTGGRGKRFINADQKITLHNVVILDAFLAT